MQGVIPTASKDDRDFIRVLGLDLGTCTGYAYADVARDAAGKVRPEKANPLHSGLWDFSKTTKGYSRDMRFIHFLDALLTIKPDYVVYEWVARHSGTAPAHVYGGFMAHLQSYCIRNGVEYKGIDVSTIKKRATGKGNANKVLMIEAANDFFEIDPELDVDYKRSKHDNQADALWLLQLVLENDVEAFMLHSEGSKG